MADQHYVVVCSDDVELFEAGVNEHVAKGYAPFGGVSMAPQHGNIHFAQAMIMESPRADTGPR